jgi:Bacterial SH3 domain
MTDDRDKRQPPEDDPSEDDGLIPDWLRDDSEKPTGDSSERLGFTGELNWRTDIEDAFNQKLNDTSDDDGFDWQQADPTRGPSSAGQGGLGFTGELDWRKLSGEEDAATPGNADDTSWVQEFADLEPDQPRGSGLTGQLDWQGSPTDDAASTADESVPDWLQGYSDASPPAAPPTESGFNFAQETEAPGEVPDWLLSYEQNQGTTEDTLPNFSEAVPAETGDPLGWMNNLQGEVIEDETFADPIEDVVPDGPDTLDWISQYTLPESPADALPDQPMDADDLPDWMQTEADPAENMPDLDFSSLRSTSTADERTDWFAEPTAETASDMPDWLQDLQPAEASPFEGKAPATDGDFLQTLLDESRQPAPQQPISSLSTGDLRDIDELLSGYQDVEFSVRNRTGELSDPGIVDFDSLLADESFNSLRDIAAPATDIPQADNLDSLFNADELGVTISGGDEVSAAALIRKQAQNERPLEDLSSRLAALHQAGLDLPTAEANDSRDVVRTLLPGVDQVIPAVPIRGGKTSLATDLNLSDAQLKKVALLKTLIAADEPGRQSPIDATLDTPDLDDVASSVRSAPATPSRRVSRQPRFRLDRFLIMAAIAAAVTAPFLVNQLQVGSLPPAQFPVVSPQQNAYRAVQQLNVGEVVIVAAEYGPASAAELDPMLDALLRHIMLQGARPLVVSGDAVGLLNAQRLLQQMEITGLARSVSSGTVTPEASRFDRPIRAGQDYLVASYLPGENLGIRSFVESYSSPAFGLNAIRDAALLVVVAEQGEDVRRWAEQALPLLDTPYILGTTAAAAPLAEPYSNLVGRDAAGVLVGYRDAYTYRELVQGWLGSGGVLGELNAAPLPATPLGATALPTATRTPTPTNTPTPTVTFTPTEGPSATPTFTFTPSNTPTNTATFTPAPPTATPVERGTLPATWTPEGFVEGTPGTVQPGPGTAAPSLNIQALVIAGESINVREGPGRNFAPVGALRPGATVEVIGRSGDGQWVQVRLEDDVEGWVFADLVRIIEPTSAATATEVAYQPPADQLLLAGLIADSSYSGSLRFQAQAATPTPDVSLATLSVPTPVPIAPPVEVTAPQLPEGSTFTLPQNIPYRDERWYGMTLGLLAIIVVIVLGTGINLIRALLRRRS